MQLITLAGGALCAPLFAPLLLPPPPLLLRPLESAKPNANSTQFDNDNTTTETPPPEANSDSVRFLVEPARQVQVLEGARLAQLQCVFATSSAARRDNKWIRGKASTLAFNETPLNRPRVEMHEQELPSGGGENKTLGQLNLLTNYTLKFADVQLGDEDEYACSVSNQRSRAGRLTVVRPPRQLQLKAQGALEPLPTQVSRVVTLIVLVEAPPQLPRPVH